MLLAAPQNQDQGLIHTTRTAALLSGVIEREHGSAFLWEDGGKEIECVTKNICGTWKNAGHTSFRGSQYNFSTVRREKRK